MIHAVRDLLFQQVSQSKAESDYYAAGNNYCKDIILITLLAT